MRSNQHPIHTYYTLYIPSTSQALTLTWSLSSCFSQKRHAETNTLSLLSSPSAICSRVLIQLLINLSLLPLPPTQKKRKTKKPRGVQTRPLAPSAPIGQAF
uniref:Uncharacterized protein n=1 Tax=Opuntia streptacantha TaxID=393608 RepID=A0A7C9DLE6_OPUST